MNFSFTVLFTAFGRGQLIFFVITITLLVFHGRSPFGLLVSDFTRTAFNEHVGGSICFAINTLGGGWKTLHGQRALCLWLELIALLELFYLLLEVEMRFLANSFTTLL